MPRSISTSDLSRRHEPVILDVRKDPARSRSGLGIPGSLHFKPFDAQNWAGQFVGKSVIVYCVHGHEVSRAVAGYLQDRGVDASFLEGGFEAWREQGLPVAPLEVGS